jgi:hypothetical protein
MKSLNLVFTVTAALVVNLLSITAVFAANGDLGATSDADSLITIEVTDAVKIVNLDEITFEDYGDTDNGGTSANDNFCVYVNGAGTYSLTASTSGGTYTLTGGTTSDTIDYTVAFNGAASTSTTAVDIDTASAEFTGSQSLTCAGGNNANVNIIITDAELLTALTDIYTQTLTVTVNPI